MGDILDKLDNVFETTVALIGLILLLPVIFVYLVWNIILVMSGLRDQER